ncbi:Wall-associated receptor kinase 3 [Triticum urartu]|uniref:Wall-associated receptor kinase 3 n=1 Tax=Triticum urartu TaxID=4572 RepID=M7YYX7_TRIUA|nr:Wall-associated receptor kinase 3 [Triticum urartu]
MTSTPSQSRLSPLLTLRLLLLLAAAATQRLILQGGAGAEEQEQQRRPITLEGCQAMCGNISIPFPFGIKPGCFVKGFQVTCNDSFDPPRVFLFYNRTAVTYCYNEMGEGAYSAGMLEPTLKRRWEAPVELMDISIAKSEARAYGLVRSDCSTNALDHLLKLQVTWLREPFYLSEKRNVLSSVGFGVEARMGSDLLGSTSYDTTCYSTVGPTCEVAFSKGSILTSFGVTFEPENNTFWENSPCSYGMVVESSWYNFSEEDRRGYEVLSNKYSRGVPVVLDFAFRDGSCPYADGSVRPGYRCVNGNSSCVNATSAEGYFCKCWEHYDGNPYIPNGCQGLAAMIVVSVLMVMFHQLLKFKRFYEQNGGPVLKGVKNIRIYTRKQIKQMTNNYRRVIGEGHFGKVYLGTLKDKKHVAIKKSIKVDKHMKQEFTDEVIIQSAMRHKNIVMLIGCCLQLDVPMLVYEFVARGSLYDVLFKCKDKILVGTRLRIAVGSAEGLTYMHSAGESTIRHGDVKSANILLDEKFTPKISDFGTSKLLARGKAEMTEHVIGDMSYIDPVYMEQGIVTQKSDVYGFGVVLIELITRRPATYDAERSYVANFVEACLAKRARNFIDNDVTSEADIDLLEMVSRVAVDCLKPNPEERQDMKQVEHRLLEIVAQSEDHSQERDYKGDFSLAPDDVALLKGLGE